VAQTGKRTPVRRLSITEARAKFSDVLRDAHECGIVTVITFHGRDVAAVVPMGMYYSKLERH
jgi:prevent-host-death family protein